MSFSFILFILVLVLVLYHFVLFSLFFFLLFRGSRVGQVPGNARDTSRDRAPNSMKFHDNAKSLFPQNATGHSRNALALLLSEDLSLFFFFVPLRTDVTSYDNRQPDVFTRDRSTRVMNIHETHDPAFRLTLPRSYFVSTAKVFFFSFCFFGNRFFV